ncbi:MAG: hypothetical protein ACOYLV_03760 [Rubrivivax sp.]
MLRPDSLCLYGVRMTVARTEEGEGQIPQLLTEQENGRVTKEQYGLKVISDIYQVVQRLTPYLGLGRTWVCITGKYFQSRFFMEEMFRAVSEGRLDPRSLGFEFNACHFEGHEYIKPEILEEFRCHGFGVSVSISEASDINLLAEVRAGFEYLRLRSSSLMASVHSSTSLSLKDLINTIVRERGSGIVLYDVADLVNYNHVFGLTVSAVERCSFPRIIGLDRFIKFLGQPEYSISRIRADSL